MIKITSRIILALSLSLTFVKNSSAQQIYINFEERGSFYTSPVVYLTGINGQSPKISMKEDIPTTAGADANDRNFTKFPSISFRISPKIDIHGIKIIPNSMNEDPFCLQLNLSLKSTFDGYKIFLPSTFPKLTTSTSCHFKIVSLENTNNEVTKNKITLIFNYTLPGWLSHLGRGTKAQHTAFILQDIDPNSKNIIIRDQNITDISPVMSFIKVEDLDLSGNQIKVIPDAMKYLTDLKFLYLSFNQIKVIPEAMVYLQNLQFLYLPYNQIKAIPESILYLKNLQYLLLYYNQIKVIPDAFGYLKNLEYLNIQNNQINVIPDTIGNLTKLNYLNLQYNQIKVIPDAIGYLTNLDELIFQNNQIKVIPKKIGNLKKLKILNLKYNQIEVIPEFIANLTHLKEIDLQYNQIQFINDSLYNWLLEKNAILSDNIGFDNNFGNGSGFCLFM